MANNYAYTMDKGLLDFKRFPAYFSYLCGGSRYATIIRSPMSVSANIHLLQMEFQTGACLVAVSKFHPREAIFEAYQAGQSISSLILAVDIL